jgi:hypothetical protein
MPKSDPEICESVNCLEARVSSKTHCNILKKQEDSYCMEEMEEDEKAKEEKAEKKAEEEAEEEAEDGATGGGGDALAKVAARDEEIIWSLIILSLGT